MKRWFLLSFLLLAGLAIAAYPHLHRKLRRFQNHRAAEATTAQITPQLRDGDLLSTVQPTQSASPLPRPTD